MRGQREFRSNETYRAYCPKCKKAVSERKPTIASNRMTFKCNCGTEWLMWIKDTERVAGNENE